MSCLQKLRAGPLALLFWLIAFRGLLVWLPAPAWPGTMDAFPLLAHYENGWDDSFPSSWPALKARWRHIDVLSPLWYSVDGEGRVSDVRFRPEVMEFCRVRGIPVMPLVTAPPAASEPRSFLSSTEATRRALAALGALVRRHGYGGLVVAFGKVSPQEREEFARFVVDLRERLRVSGRRLWVYLPDAHSIQEWPPELFDRLATAAERLVIPAYDRHNLHTGPGPVAPAPWVRELVREIAAHVPTRQLVLGLGAFGYEWPAQAGAGKAEYVSTNEARARADQQGVSPERDPESGEMHYRYRRDGLPREVWYQDEVSLRLLIGLAREEGLGGVAYWRLGFGGDALWEEPE